MWITFVDTSEIFETQAKWLTQPKWHNLYLDVKILKILQ